MINWDTVDTVLLDMDGTLLDLRFDNYFWQHFLPLHYAEQNGLETEHALASIQEKYDAKRATLDWYCTDFWSRELAVDIPALKRQVQHLIGERPHARQLLKALGAKQRQRILITNAHRHSLELKLEVTAIDELLDLVISSHDYGAPKESQDFWHRLAQHVEFDPARTLFIDDTESMLHAAQEFGIAHLLCITQPDSRGAPRGELHFPAIEHFSDLLPIH